MGAGALGAVGRAFVGLVRAAGTRAQTGNVRNAEKNARRCLTAIGAVARISKGVHGFHSFENAALAAFVFVDGHSEFPKQGTGAATWAAPDRDITDRGPMARRRFRRGTFSGRRHWASCPTRKRRWAARAWHRRSGYPPRPRCVPARALCRGSHRPARRYSRTS
jgi:hypothetical protein